MAIITPELANAGTQLIANHLTADIIAEATALVRPNYETTCADADKHTDVEFLLCDICRDPEFYPTTVASRAIELASKAALDAIAEMETTRAANMYVSGAGYFGFDDLYECIRRHHAPTGILEHGIAATVRALAPLQ